MEMENIIYLLILSHGIHEYNNSRYNNDNDETIIHAKERKPTLRKSRIFMKPNVIIPENIEFIQKITYTPFGLYNILSPDDKISIYNNSLNLINKEIVIGEPLTELIKNEITFETIESKLAKPENPEYILEDLKLLISNRNSICQSFIYNKSSPDNKALKDKSFSSDDNDDEINDDENENKEMNGIYVIYQKEGPLNIGDNILSQTTNITTQMLLELMNNYGYKNIIIIDYSCEICTSIFGMKPEDSHVEDLRTKINLGKIGRGGKKSKRKYKNRHNKTFKI